MKSMVDPVVEAGYLFPSIARLDLDLVPRTR